MYLKKQYKKACKENKLPVDHHSFCLGFLAGKKSEIDEQLKRWKKKYAKIKEGK